MSFGASLSRVRSRCNVLSSRSTVTGKLLSGGVYAGRRWPQTRPGIEIDPEQAFREWPLPGRLVGRVVVTTHDAVGHSLSRRMPSIWRA